MYMYINLCVINLVCSILHVHCIPICIVFQMNTSCIHWSGALLLEPTNQIFLDLGRDGDGRARVSMGLQLNDDMEGVLSDCIICIIV